MIHDIVASGKYWVLLLMIPSIIVVAGFFLFLIIAMAKKRLEPLAKALGEKVVMSFSKGAYIPFLYEGIKYRIAATSGGRNSPSYLVLKQMTPFGFNLSIFKEDAISRSLGSMRILKDLEIGDPVFDERYRIRSNDPTRAQAFLQNSDRRAGTDSLLKEGFEYIKADKESFSIMKRFRGKADPGKKEIFRTLERIRTLTSA